MAYQYIEKPALATSFINTFLNNDGIQYYVNMCFLPRLSHQYIQPYNIKERPYLQKIYTCFWRNEVVENI